MSRIETTFDEIQEFNAEWDNYSIEERKIIIKELRKQLNGVTEFSQ